METPMNAFEKDLVQLRRTLTDFYNRYKDDILNNREIDRTLAQFRDSVYDYLYKRGKIKRDEIGEVK